MKANKLRAYYDALPREGGFDATCAMDLRGPFAGKRVLDLGCRKGKGVYKLSELVGDAGFAVGIDPSVANIRRALAGQGDAWRKGGLSANNMAFYVGFPEDLAALGLEDSTFDVVFINSSLNVARKPKRVLREAFRVLAPDGRLVLDTVTADDKRAGDVVDAARALGNVIQAAPAHTTLQDWTYDAGFRVLEFLASFPVRPSMGCTPDQPYPTVPTDEEVTFTHWSALAYKSREAFENRS